MQIRTCNRVCELIPLSVINLTPIIIAFIVKIATNAILFIVTIVEIFSEMINIMLYRIIGCIAYNLPMLPPIVEYTIIITHIRNIGQSTAFRAKAMVSKPILNLRTALVVICVAERKCGTAFYMLLLILKNFLVKRTALLNL